MELEMHHDASKVRGGRRAYQLYKQCQGRGKLQGVGHVKVGG